MDNQEAKARIEYYHSHYLQPVHNELGPISIVKVQDSSFLGSVVGSGVIDFPYSEIGQTITLDVGGNHDNGMGYDPSLYGKHRKTIFSYTGRTESQQRHDLNSTKKLR